MINRELHERVKRYERFSAVPHSTRNFADCDPYFGSKAFKKVDNSIQIEGTIIRFDGRGRPIVSYNIDGADYVFVGNYRTSLMRIGQKIQILYDLETMLQSNHQGGIVSCSHHYRRHSALVLIAWDCHAGTGKRRVD